MSDIGEAFAEVLGVGGLPSPQRPPDPSGRPGCDSRSFADVMFDKYSGMGQSPSFTAADERAYNDAVAKCVDQQRQWDAQHAASSASPASSPQGSGPTPLAGGMGAMGMGMPFNYGAGVASIFSTAGDLMQQQADKDAAEDAARKVKEQKEAIDAQMAQVQKEQALQAKLAAVKPSAESQKRLKAAAKKSAAVQAQLDAFHAQHPEYLPQAQQPKKKTSPLVYAGAAVAIAGLGLFAWKRWMR